MNRDEIEGNWRQVAGKMKEHWGTLIGDPYVVDVARRDQFAGKVQQRRGISQRESARQLRDFLVRNRNWFRLD